MKGPPETVERPAPGLKIECLSKDSHPGLSKLAPSEARARITNAAPPKKQKECGEAVTGRPAPLPTSRRGRKGPPAAGRRRRPPPAQAGRPTGRRRRPTEATGTNVRKVRELRRVR